MKSNLFIYLVVSTLILVTCRSENTSSPVSGNEVAEMSNAAFKKMIFNYGPGKAWENVSGKPVLIDFYADWCVPCRKMTPVVEELAKEYAGKIIVYKVNIDKERDLAENMRITSIPSFMFIPSKGKPVFSRGIAPKEDLIKVINDILLTNQ